MIGEGFVFVFVMFKEINNVFSDIESGKFIEEVVVEKEDEVDVVLLLLEEKEVVLYFINEVVVVEILVVDFRFIIFGNNVVMKEVKELVNEFEVDNINLVIIKDLVFVVVNEIF